MSTGLAIACAVLGPLGFLATLALIWAACRVGADADGASDELLCSRLQRECVAVPARQPVGGIEVVSGRVRRGYQGAHR